ncbi:MAG: M15 family metallopeptidase [Deltaproteobacteria bacterium]|nr:M15 family metallopeptidase [Deltaproteobacteria bacterium]
MSNFYLGRKSLSNLIGVYPELGFIATEAIKITSQDFTIFDGVRTDEEQREMVNSGASITMDSYHLYGLAIDLVPWINGAARWEEEPCKKVIVAIKEVIRAHGLEDIENGYDMWGWDLPHWQKSGYKEKYDFRRLDTFNLLEA